METKAVHRYLNSFSLWTASIAALVAVVGLALVAAPASAKRFSLVGRDGKIHGCYRVKGKPKGMLRVVRARRYHCRRGERKVSWTVATTAGPSGSAGQAGQNGQPVAPSQSTTSKETLLQSEVADLTLKVKSLEDLLSGVSTGDLSGLLGRVNLLEGVLEGVDNEGLKEAVGAVSAVEELCSQTPILAERANTLQEVIEGLGLNGVLTALGGLLEVNGLPATLLNLGEFGCGAP